MLEPIKGDLVVELGCGSGLLTRHLAEAGHQVIATDASPAMLDIARQYVPGSVTLQELVLPDDPIPDARAIVSVGHVLSYLPGEEHIDRALASIAKALLPGGIVALDICDLRWGEARREAPNYSRVETDWALITEFSLPAPNRFVRRMAAFRKNEDDSWRRDDEIHKNTLIDTTSVPRLFAEHDVEVTVGSSFGNERLPEGLCTVVGVKR